jgi:hypothetical protein
MLINPRDMKKINPEPQIPEPPVQRQPETQPQNETQVQFD